MTRGHYNRLYVLPTACECHVYCGKGSTLLIMQAHAYGGPETLRARNAQLHLFLGALFSPCGNLYDLKAMPTSCERKAHCGKVIGNVGNRSHLAHPDTQRTYGKYCQ